MQLKSIIMDEAAVRRSMTRITHEIIEKNNGTADLVLLGIHRRGIPLAAMLRDNMFRFEGKEVPIGCIDISLYRDDLTELSPLPETGRTEIPCDLTGKTVILVDDVIYTGRTVRAETAELLILQAFRGHVEQFVGTGPGLVQGGVEFPGPQGTVDAGGGDPGGSRHRNNGV